jgi:hypothetical protein
VSLERAQVIVHLLAREAHPRSERCGRARLDELGQQPGPHRVEGDHRGGRIVDHFEVDHGRIGPLARFVVHGLASESAREGCSMPVVHALSMGYCAALSSMAGTRLGPYEVVMTASSMPLDGATWRSIRRSDADERFDGSRSGDD